MCIKLIALFNVAMLTVLIVCVESAFYKITIAASVVLVSYIVFTISLKRSIAQYMHIALLAVVMFFVSLEVVFRVFPAAIPSGLKVFMYVHENEGLRQRIVEYLPDCPFVKFKPNVEARSQLYRGTPEQFVYDWQTDSLGFKNPLSLDIQSVQVLALGDSFTEGMGVPTEMTWPGRLTALGVSTYNMGVQGYAPTQAKCTLKVYGELFSPKVVVFGYTGTIADRNTGFLPDRGTPSEEERERALDSVISNEREIRYTTTQATTAFFLLVNKVYKYGLGNGMFSNVTLDNPAFNIYLAELLDLETETVIPFEQSAAWKATLSDFEDVQAWSLKHGARMALVYFPHRAISYYPSLMKKPLPTALRELEEARILSNFCREKGIIFVNMTPVFHKYMADLPAKPAFADLPYLQLDGHMSAKGCTLTALALRDALSRADNVGVEGALTKAQSRP